ncbi:twin-arginine translocase TatA/TatE family subunit [Curtobacterium luteum]|uniref:twin-arginine translocase TatA/TatE family subunit n=1 Tax=Curtobacterium luteum TaxID=33881 RepID=UPI003828602A
MLQNLTGWHAVIILAIVLLVFGAAKLPALARSVGQSMRIIKTELHDTTDGTALTPTAQPTTPIAFTQPPAQDKTA